MNPSDRAEISNTSSDVIHELFTSAFDDMITKFPKRATVTGPAGFQHLVEFKRSMTAKLEKYERDTAFLLAEFQRDADQAKQDYQDLIEINNHNQSIAAPISNIIIEDDSELQRLRKEVAQLKNKNEALMVMHEGDMKSRNTWHREFKAQLKQLQEENAKLKEEKNELEIAASAIKVKLEKSKDWQHQVEKDLITSMDTSASLKCEVDWWQDFAMKQAKNLKEYRKELDSLKKD